MLEVLDLQEMQKILGGASNFCDSMQKIANIKSSSSIYTLPIELLLKMSVRAK